MQTNQSKQNNSNNLHHEDSVDEEPNNPLLPQIKGLIADATTVLRGETGLLEAHFFDRVKKLETRLLLSLAGAGALLFALGLFVFTIVYEIAELFPAVPIWAVTGVMSVMICVLGGFILTEGSQSCLTSKGAKDYVK